MGTLFGQYFKERRMKLGKTLRQFCLDNGLDAANISKIERGISAAPQNRKNLEKYAVCLGIIEGTDEWFEFFDRARSDAGRIPEEILANKNIVARLPLVFRTLRGQKLTAEQYEQIINLLHP
jgi:transcriptional regulator with XRE-family HTH domain